MCSRALYVALITVLSSLTGGSLPADEPAAAKLDLPALYRILVEKKIGFIDRNGQVVIKSQFDWAYDFSEGMCQVNLAGNQGYIDHAGKWAFEIETHDDRPFRCGVAVVCTGKRTGIVDRTGRVIDCPYHWMRNFSEGLSAVYVIPEKVTKQGPEQGFGTTGEKWGFVDTAGKLVIPTKFTAAGDFHGGLAPVYVGGANTGDTGLRGGKWGYINKAGEFVINPQFQSAQGFSEGLAVVSFDGENFGWIDTTGKFAIKMRRLTLASSFHDGVARIRGDTDSIPGWKDFGYITTDGEVFIHPSFDASSSPFSDGLAEAHDKPIWDAEKGKWIKGKLGFVNKRGDWVIAPQYSHTKPFRHGLAYGSCPCAS